MCIEWQLGIGASKGLHIVVCIVRILVGESVQLGDFFWLIVASLVDHCSEQVFGITTKFITLFNYSFEYSGTWAEWANGHYLFLSFSNCQYYLDFVSYHDSPKQQPISLHCITRSWGKWSVIKRINIKINRNICLHRSKDYCQFCNIERTGQNETLPS